MHFFSKCTPLEHCCVHNMSPFVSSSGLSPGSREAKVQRAKVCLNWWSQVWLGLPAGRFQSGGTCRIHAARARWWSSRGELWAVLNATKSYRLRRKLCQPVRQASALVREGSTCHLVNKGKEMKGGNCWTLMPVQEINLNAYILTLPWQVHCQNLHLLQWERS